MTSTIMPDHAVSARLGTLAPAEFRGTPCRAKPDDWFPEAGDQLAQARAKAGCAACPFRGPCLAFALATRQQHGIWGGLTEDERREVAPRICPRCGRDCAPRRVYCGDACAEGARNESRAAQEEIRRARRRGRSRHRRAALHTVRSS